LTHKKIQRIILVGTTLLPSQV